MKRNHKYRNPFEMKPAAAEPATVRTGNRYAGARIYLSIILLLMILLQSFNFNVEAKTLHRFKRPLKRWKSSSSLIQQVRLKRDTFANELQQHEQMEQLPVAHVYYMNANYSDDDDNDYDEVIPDMSSGPHTPIGEQISERAKQVAESFTNMWQSLTASIKHCMDVLRGLFGDDEEYELTDDEQGQMRVAIAEQYLNENNIRNNEVFMNENIL